VSTDPQPRPAPDRLDRPDLSEGAALPVLAVEVDTVMVVASAAATWTFFEGHTSTAYAQRQGRRDVYLATGPILGLVDAYAARCLGPAAFLRRRKVSMRESICAGDTVELAAVVARRWQDEAGAELVALTVTVTNQLGATCAQGELTLALAAGAGRPIEEGR
jgi:hypothetical protein